MSRQLASICVVALILGGTTALAQYTQELWNDATQANNLWAYWDEDYLPPPNSHHPMEYMPTNGLGDSGYVRAPLGDLDPEHDEDPTDPDGGMAFWPAYCLADWHSIDLSIPNAQIKIYAQADGGPFSPPHLQGGSLHFFIGSWDDESNYRFFHTVDAVYINSALNRWLVESSLDVSQNSDWAEITSAGPAIPPTSLLHNPQQWGFVIYPASETPTGILGFDSFRIVPEPTTILLLAIGGVAILRRRN